MKKKDSAVRWGLALFLTVGAILLFYDTLFGRRVLPSFGGQLLKALQPVLIGAVLAYLLAPVIDFIENLFFPEQMKKAHAEGRMTSRSARAVSLVVTWVIIGLLCYLWYSWFQWCHLGNDQEGKQGRHSERAGCTPSCQEERPHQL